MGTRICVILILMCCACQTGRIPCPDARGPRIHKVKTYNAKRYQEYTASISVQRDQGASAKQSTQAKETFVHNVKQEDWDCPKPGERKYMPKSIKDNIRKNMKRIRSAEKQKMESDTIKSR